MYQVAIAEVSGSDEVSCNSSVFPGSFISWPVFELNSLLEDVLHCFWSKFVSSLVLRGRKGFWLVHRGSLLTRWGCSQLHVLGCQNRFWKSISRTNRVTCRTDLLEGQSYISDALRHQAGRGYSNYQLPSVSLESRRSDISSSEDVISRWHSWSRL